MRHLPTHPGTRLHDTCTRELTPLPSAPMAMHSLLPPTGYVCPPGTPVDPVPILMSHDSSGSMPRGSPDEGPEFAPVVRTPSKQSLGSSPKLHSARAAIMSHETRSEDKRFTVYKIDLSTDDHEFSVFHRYSEFRELFEVLNKKFSKELASVRFPRKHFVGNFDPVVIQARQKSLQDFIQTVLQNSNICEDENVKKFLLETPRHGRGHMRHRSDEVAELEEAGRAEVPGKEENRFDLGESENKKASVEDFTMLKIIGKGSFGKVLLARHNPTQRLYAVKVLSKDLIIRQNETKHIMSERNVLMANVAHPFLVGLQFSFQTPSKLYFVLDYANGGELFFHLQREKRFSIQRALFYSAEITSALGFMHRNNVLYRDLKPENILFDLTGHVMLTDFGLCKENLGPGDTTATFCGTPEYLAPEVLRRQRYGRAVDWWCLGCVTYEMMCGLPPFYSRHCDEMYERILRDELRFPEHVPPAARDFLRGLLSKDPAVRLGASRDDSVEVQRHPFFAAIDWAALDRMEAPPPWVPMVSDGLDLRHFDPVFVNESISQSVAVGGAMEEPRSHSMRVVNVSDINPFDGFSFGGDTAIPS